jgi:hypothetical protein
VLLDGVAQESRQPRALVHHRLQLLRPVLLAGPQSPLLLREIHPLRLQRLEALGALRVNGCNEVDTVTCLDDPELLEAFRLVRQAGSSGPI